MTYKRKTLETFVAITFSSTNCVFLDEKAKNIPLIKRQFQLAESFGQIEYSLTKNQVTNALDLNAIGEKILANAYSCLEAFWSDVKWIAHNTKVHRSGKWHLTHSNFFPNLNFVRKFEMSWITFHSRESCSEKHGLVAQTRQRNDL